jgi:hypothetical protein
MRMFTFSFVFCNGKEKQRERNFCEWQDSNIYLFEANNIMKECEKRGNI